LTKSNMIVVPQPSYFSVFPIEDKTEKPPFWHNWGDRGIIAEDAEHPRRTRLLGCISNGRSTEKGAQARKGTTSMVIVASRPKDSFWPGCSTSPGNYTWLLV
jgi:hypothetical protein